MERLTPGQGGGSGSSQGVQNLVRSGITTGLAGLGGATGGVPGAIIAPSLALSAFSPKLMTQGTIRNIGNLYNALNRQIPESVRRLLVPLSVKTTAPML